MVAVGCATFSIPLSPYLHIFYMEAFLFMLVCISWGRVQDKESSFADSLLTGALIIAIPSVHMRGSVVASALYAILVWQPVNSARPPMPSEWFSVVSI